MASQYTILPNETQAEYEVRRAAQLVREQIRTKNHLGWHVALQQAKDEYLSQRGSTR